MNEIFFQKTYACLKNVHAQSVNIFFILETGNPKKCPS